MAATPDVTRRTQITLDTAAAMLDDVLDLDGTWTERPEEWRADFCLDWEAVVQRLEDLRSDRCAAEVTPRLRADLEGIGRQMLAVRDTLHALGLDVPRLGPVSHAS